MSALVAATAAAAAGLASSVHCAAMCGPLAAVAGRTPRAAAAYHGARLASYALAGGIAGATGTLLSDALGGRWAGALLSWTLAVALALAAWRLWRGEARPGERLVALGAGRAHRARRGASQRRATRRRSAR
ncbi:MAG: sulfite exporter TauE/SafE family protein [Sandaracinaceae bacterium]|nr:sulfite exporter TauE/SafE family protein [Sandaracinaceae bacterium]